jgi:hypothetical protein
MRVEAWRRLKRRAGKASFHETDACPSSLRNSLRIQLACRFQSRDCSASRAPETEGIYRPTASQMSKKGAAGATAAGSKRKVREVEEDFDWDALLGEEMEGGVDLDEMGRVMVSKSKIWYVRVMRPCIAA